MVRKSKNVGQIINDFLILDSIHVGKDTKYLLRCQKCGKEYYKSRTFIKNKGKCCYCGNGRNYHNAQGYEHTRLYERYMSILRRVKNHKEYAHVQVCQEWVNDYTAFMKWALENGYDDSLTIDRIDNAKGYSPDNCRWVSLKKQANNRTSNVFIEYKGKKFTIAEFADFINLPYNTVLLRFKNKWSLEDIAKTPYMARKKWSEINTTNLNDK